MPLPLESLTAKILESAFEVANDLGPGFLESIYEAALFISLKERGIVVERQFPIKVRFHGQVIGHFYTDLLVENQVIIELKAAKGLATEHSAQTLNYLKATGMPVALLLNFGTSKIEVRRFDNHFEKIGLTGMEGMEGIKKGNGQSMDFILGKAALDE
jgi:GxxExxY protein